MFLSAQPLKSRVRRFELQLMEVGIKVQSQQNLLNSKPHTLQRNTRECKLLASLPVLTLLNGQARGANEVRVRRPDSCFVSATTVADSYGPVSLVMTYPQLSNSMSRCSRWKLSSCFLEAK